MDHLIVIINYINILIFEILIFCSMLALIIGLIIVKKYMTLSQLYKNKIFFDFLDLIIPFYKFDIYYYLYKEDNPKSKIIIYRILILIFKILLFFILILIFFKIHRK